MLDHREMRIEPSLALFVMSVSSPGSFRSHVLDDDGLKKIIDHPAEHVIAFREIIEHHFIRKRAGFMEQFKMLARFIT